VLQGIGAALLLPNSLALLNATFEGEERGRAIGIWASVGAGAAAVAPLIGGWLVDHVGWPAIFYINLPLAAGAFLIAARFAAESYNQEAARTDFPGALMATLGLLGVTYALTLWSVRMTFDPPVLVLGLGGLLLLGVFLWVEARRGDKAMLPLDIFASRTFAGTNLLTFLLYGAFGAIMLLLPYVLIEAAGYSPLQAGLAMTPLAVIIAVASPIMGKLTARIGGQLPLTAGPLVVAAGLVLATRIDAEGSYAKTALPALLVLACGMALAVAPLTSTVLSAVDQRHAGTASGLNSAVARTGGLIATALLGAVLVTSGDALIDAFHIALLVAAVSECGGRCRRLVHREPIGQSQKKGRRSLSSDGLSIVLLGEPSR
jgi:MFS family permease